MRYTVTIMLMMSLFVCVAPPSLAGSRIISASGGKKMACAGKVRVSKKRSRGASHKVEHKKVKEDVSLGRDGSMDVLVNLRSGAAKKDMLFYWHVYGEDIRRGYVSISNSEFERIGSWPSIQVFINKKDQGKHFGRAAYLAACLESHLPVVYAHMRKSNKASQKAAEYAGFQVATKYTGNQLLMVWRQEKQEK